MPVTSFVQVKQGQAVALPFAFDGAPLLTGMTLVFTLFNPDGTVALTVTPTPDTGLSADTIPVPIPQTGTALVVLSHAQTAALAPGSYPFELHRTDPGYEDVPADGAVEVQYTRMP